MLDGYYELTDYQDQTLHWLHFVLNYIGSDYGQGVRIYFNGGEDVVSLDTKQTASHPSGSGRVVVGRFSTEDDASLEVDELLFFNEKLSDQEIMDIKSMN